MLAADDPGLPEPTYRNDLRRVRHAIVEAQTSDTPAQRYAAAYAAAMGVAVAVLAVRARPGRERQHPVNLWEVLSEAAPEYAEWAGFFAMCHPRQQLVLAGTRPGVTEREADDLLRDAQEFCDLVERRFARAWRARHG